MRRLIVASAAISVAAACGSNDSGSGKKEPTQVNLRITTSGNGLVRGAGSDCRGSCTAQVPSGSAVHLVAVPDSGASFTSWSGACSGSSGCDLTMDADRDVSATFSGAPPPPPTGQHRLTVVIQGKGRVTSSPAGLDCDSMPQCTADFASGASVALTATAASGFNFDGWGAGCSGSGGCSVTLSDDKTVFANFVAAPPPPPSQAHLTASVTGPGTVTGAGLNCGESSSTCDVMVATGSTVTLTAAPAGGTRFTGWGGACSGTATTCQLTLQSDTKVTAEFQSEVLVLAANDGTNGALIALNSTHVFWPRYRSAGNQIWSVGKNGAGATGVADGYAFAIVADDSYLYWTDGSNLYSTPVGGGQVALLFSSAPIGKLALDETGALYWTVGSSGTQNSGSVHRMQGRKDSVLATGVNPMGAVGVDATHVYFTDYSSQGAIRRVPRGGGAVESVVQCGANCYPQALRLDSQKLYYRLYWSAAPSATGLVLAADKSDWKGTTLSTGNGDGGYMYNMDVDVNAGVAYWNWNGGHAPYGIFRAKSDGSGWGAVDSSNDTSWAALRVDDTAVYYWHAGALIRRLK